MTKQYAYASALAGLAALTLAAPLTAAGYIIIPDIKGESGAATAGIEGEDIDARVSASGGEEVRNPVIALRFAEEGEKAGSATGKRKFEPVIFHKRVAETQAEGESGYTGGVTVASGDVNGDGSDDAAAAKPLPVRKMGNITLKRGMMDSAGAAAKPVVTYGPVITIKPKGDHKGPDFAVSAGDDPQQVALLLPAVQKVREAAARRSAGQPCRVGPVGAPVLMRDDATGGSRVIHDAEIVACDVEEISFTFSRITWE